MVVIRMKPSLLIGYIAWVLLFCAAFMLGSKYSKIKVFILNLLYFILNFVILSFLILLYFILNFTLLLF